MVGKKKGLRQLAYEFGPFEENEDERVRGMCAWALGRIGGDEVRAALKGFLPRSEGRVREEVEQAIEALRG